MFIRNWLAWRIVLISGVALFGIVISIVVFFVARDIELEFAKQQFVGKASEDALVIKAAIAQDLDKISGLRALFETFPDVNLLKFQSFARRLIEHDTSILSASWIERVTREGRAAHEADGLRQGIPDYHIRAVGPLGVCRDYAHLAITFCRCMNIPARYCTGYLSDIGTPQPWAVGDFASWLEAYIGGRWLMFDPRNNVPRIGRVLIAQGRDASDVPITQTFGPNTLVSFKVWTDEVA
jgi:hypothetical protein